MKTTFLILATLLFASPAMAAGAANPNCVTNWKGGACGLTEMSPGASYGGGPTVETAPPTRKECETKKV